MRILAGDIGGTKTLLRLINDGAIEKEERFESAGHDTFDSMLRVFLPGNDRRIDSACFAVAGPVLSDSAKVTNLTWAISATELVKAFPIAKVTLVNDFYAVARGVPSLTSEDLLSLNRGQRDASSPIAILGAGTGLGQAILIPVGTRWKVIASEGGHSDFAPRNDAEIELLRFLIARHGHVSAERVISGHGISNIYEHFTGEAVDAGEIAKRVGNADAQAARAFDIFVDAYGAEAGNLALKVLARGGVYLAGGVAANNQDRFTDGRFMRAFADKGRFDSLMLEIPVDLILNQQVGLLGAVAIAEETV
jgi:glucokinase